MTTKEFIEKAIEGGMKHTCIDNQYPEIDSKGYLCNGVYSSIEKIILDPKAWQAVGKVEGWTYISESIVPAKKQSRVIKNRGVIEVEVPEYTLKRKNTSKNWRNKMHAMIDHLVDGGTIESYLETL